ncbi:hypothetical protein EVAR_61223_1 [Eumeta japonica]|uniref:Uncharacterized protein n=1 Tax=Eumeta variegata TaxID=151549 RepID=A0A4C1Z9M6_EUMVA|nr:hypothetical protein EVAR_61223_1 [Eumeta japonica]
MNKKGEEEPRASAPDSGARYGTAQNLCPGIRSAPINATRVVAPRPFPVFSPIPRSAPPRVLGAHFTSPSLPEIVVTVEDDVGVPIYNSS